MAGEGEVVMADRITGVATMARFTYGFTDKLAHGDA